MQPHLDLVAITTSLPWDKLILRLQKHIEVVQLSLLSNS
jgi:hypothetical protein